MPNQKNIATKTEIIDDNQTIIQSASEAKDKYQEMPRAYKKEYATIFKTLPPALRQYLHERESEIERGFSKLNNEVNAKRWIDEVFGNRAKRLCRHGIKKPQEWIEAMAKIDDALDSDPSQALHYLSKLYGGAEALSANSDSNQNSDISTIQSHINDLEVRIQEISDLVKNSHLQAKKLDEAQKAKDAAFAPRGKNSRKDLSELSTREILELKMSEYD